MNRNFEAFNECVFISDQSSWVWNTTVTFFENHKIPFVHLASNTSIRRSWSRISQAPKIIIHWESRFRHGGAIVEELLSVDPKFEMEDKLIVIVSDPSPEDQVYIDELRIANVVTLRNNRFDIRNASMQLKALFYKDAPGEVKQHKVWRKLFYNLKLLSPGMSPEQLKKIRSYIHRTGALDKHDSDRYFYAQGMYHFKLGEREKALSWWQKSLERNPNFNPTREAMIDLLCEEGKFQKALNQLRQMQVRNKNHVSRLVKIGQIHSKLEQKNKAEHYFTSALNKDQYCGEALNGLASIRFEQGKLDESRHLLSQSAVAYRIAAKLNAEGIKMVKDQNYETALKHYSKAHFVLPQQEKGPMLFYNMGLCYSRWGKNLVAKRFLELALIKEPNYKKAKRLLGQLSA